MAITEALTILKDKVAGSYGANKKLNLIKSEKSTPEATTTTTTAAAEDAEKAAKIEEKRKELLAEKEKVAKQEEELEELKDRRETQGTVSREGKGCQAGAG